MLPDIYQQHTEDACLTVICLFGPYWQQQPDSTDEFSQDISDLLLERRSYVRIGIHLYSKLIKRF